MKITVAALLIYNILFPVCILSSFPTVSFPLSMKLICLDCRRKTVKICCWCICWGLFSAAEWYTVGSPVSRTACDRLRMNSRTLSEGISSLLLLTSARPHIGLLLLTSGFDRLSLVSVPHAARQNRPVPGRPHVRRRQGGPGGLQRVHQDHHSCHHPSRRLCQKTAHVLRGELGLMALQVQSWESDQASVRELVQEMYDQFIWLMREYSDTRNKSQDQYSQLNRKVFSIDSKMQLSEFHALRLVSLIWFWQVLIGIDWIMTTFMKQF